MRRRKLLLTLVLFLVSWLVLARLTSRFNLEDFRSLVEGLGALGPLAVFAYIVLSHVFAPLGGTPGLLIGLAAFGFVPTLLLTYLASLTSAAINFYLACRYGRRLVAKLAGKKAMGDIDLFTAASGVKVLILSRLFGFALFELVSYAAGLTKINFKKYLLITALFTPGPYLALFVIFRDSAFSETSLALWLGTIILSGLVFTLVFRKYLAKNDRP